MKLYNVIIIILAVLVIVGASLEYHSTTSNDPNTIKVAYLPTDHSAALLFASRPK